jgi:hypothetical protein
MKAADDVVDEFGSVDASSQSLQMQVRRSKSTSLLSLSSLRQLLEVARDRCLAVGTTTRYRQGLTSAMVLVLGVCCRCCVFADHTLVYRQTRDRTYTWRQAASAGSLSSCSLQLQRIPVISLPNSQTFTGFASIMLRFMHGNDRSNCFIARLQL